MSNVTSAKKDMQQAGDKARDAANTVADKAKEAAGGAYDKLKEAGGHMGDAASSAASAAGRQAENLTERAGQGMQSLAGTVREQGPQGGMLGSATRGVASGLEQAGKYIEDKNLSGMADDLTSLIKNNPIPALLLGLGVGFLLGRAIRS